MVRNKVLRIDNSCKIKYSRRSMYSRQINYSVLSILKHISTILYLHIYTMYTRILLSGLLIASSFFFLTGCSNNTDPSKTFWPDTDTAQYMKYDTSKVQASLDAWDDVMIFVWATRCPPCMALHDDIMANIDQIPDNLSIYAVDYDAQKEIVKQYKVTAKHTSVYLDKNWDVKLSQRAQDYTLDNILETAAEIYK